MMSLSVGDCVIFREPHPHAGERAVFIGYESVPMLRGKYPKFRGGCGIEWFATRRECFVIYGGMDKGKCNGPKEGAPMLEQNGETKPPEKVRAISFAQLIDELQEKLRHLQSQRDEARERAAYLQEQLRGVDEYAEHLRRQLMKKDRAIADLQVNRVGIYQSHDALFSLINEVCCKAQGAINDPGKMADLRSYCANVLPLKALGCKCRKVNK